MRPVFLSPPRLTFLRPLAVATAIMVAATGLIAVLDTELPVSALALVYIAAVLLVAYRCAFGYAIASALAAVINLNVFFVHPRGQLQVDSDEHGLVLGALLVVSLFASYLAARQRELHRQAERRSRHATRLRQLASDLGMALDTDTMVARTLAHLHLRFGSGTLALIKSDQVEPHSVRPGLIRGDEPLQRHGDAPPAHAALTTEALRHCIDSAQSIGAGTPRWPSLRATCIPLVGPGGVLGALGVARAAVPDTYDMDELQTVADMLTASIQRERHATESVEARALAQSQALRNTLLASVSHDFRTPLASIIGSASALVQQHDRLPAHDALRLARQIENEARYLADMTENTLHWIRLSNGGPPPMRDWQSVGEIISEVVARIKRRDSSVDLDVRLPDTLPLIQADAVLMAQAITNLLDNALKYAQSPVVVSAAQHDDRIWIDVADRGLTLSPQERSRIFETFYRCAHARSVRGAGLGLSITLAIAQAHEGGLTVLPRRDGGNIFRLDLPVPPAPEMAADLALDSGVGETAP